MRRFLIGERDAAARIQLAVFLALHQHADAVGEPGDFNRLLGDDIGQLVHRAVQVGDLFFELCLVGCHGAHLARGPRRGEAQAATSKRGGRSPSSLARSMA